MGAVAADDFEEDSELEIGIFGDQESPLKIEFNKLYGTTNDQFLNVPKSMLTAAQKRQMNKLQKGYSVGFPTAGTKPVNPGMVNQTFINESYVTSPGGARPKFLTPEQIYNGYFLWHLATPPYDVYYLQELLYANSTHYAAVRAKVTNIVGLGHTWKPTSKVLTAIQSAADKDEDSPDGDDKLSTSLGRRLQMTMESLDEQLESLNPMEAWIDTLTKIWIDVETTGNGYMEIGRNRDGSIGYVGHIPSYTMRVRVDRDGFVQMLPSQLNRLVFFRNYGDTTTQDIFGNDPSPNEVIHFKKESPKNAYYGIPDIVAGLPAIAGDKFASEYNLEYFENKAVPRYALIVKGAKLSAQSERRLLEYFRREVRGKNHGTLYIPVPSSAGGNVDVELKPIEATQQEFSFGSYREFNRAEICMVHRVPLSQLGVTQANLSAATSEAKVFKDQVCSPEQRRMEWKLNLIIKTFTDMYKLKLSSYTLIDELNQSIIDDRYIRNGVYCPNDVLTRMGKQPRRGGNQFLNPNMEPGQDANENKSGAQPPQPAKKPMGIPKKSTNDGSPKNANTAATPTARSLGQQKPKLTDTSRNGESRR